MALNTGQNKTTVRPPVPSSAALLPYEKSHWPFFNDWKTRYRPKVHEGLSIPSSWRPFPISCRGDHDLFENRLSFRIDQGSLFPVLLTPHMIDPGCWEPAPVFSPFICLVILFFRGGLLVARVRTAPLFRETEDPQKYRQSLYSRPFLLRDLISFSSFGSVSNTRFTLGGKCSAETSSFRNLPRPKP